MITINQDWLVFWRAGQEIVEIGLVCLRRAVDMTAFEGALVANVKDQRFPMVEQVAGEFNVNATESRLLDHSGALFNEISELRI
jgi:hypothetical protein